MRADARRNRTRILKAAYDAFAADGPSVPVDEVARRAGVGAGTLYRHFPTKHALLEAVVLERAEPIRDQARELAQANDPAAAFLEFFDLIIERRVANRALAEAAAESLDPRAMPSLWQVEQEIQAAMQVLLTRGQQAGALRTDIELRDLKAMISGAVAMCRERGDRTRVTQLLIEGIRA